MTSQSEGTYKAENRCNLLSACQISQFIGRKNEQIPQRKDKFRLVRFKYVSLL